MDKEARKYKRELQKLSDAALLFLDALDCEMRQPSDAGRGSRIAKICNGLDYVNDSVRYFALGVNAHHDDKKRLVAKLLKKYGVAS